MKYCILICCLFGLITNARTQTTLSSDAKITDFKNSHYQQGEVKGSVATDSLLKVLKFEALFTIPGNQSNTNCPAFGVYGKAYHKLYAEIKQVNQKCSRSKFKAVLFLTQEETKQHNLQLEIKELILYPTQEIDGKVLEITGSFKSQKEELEGVFKIILGLSNEGLFLDKSVFTEENGYQNTWMAKNQHDELLAWGFQRFPSQYFLDFDIGNGELMVNYKYLENGWSSTFSKQDFVKERAENIPVSDYHFYEVTSKEDIINEWDRVAVLLGEQWGYTADKLDLGCEK